MSTIYQTLNKARQFKLSLLAKSKALMLCLFLLAATVANASITLGIAGSANVSSIQSGSQFIYTVNYSISSLTDVGHGVVADIALPVDLALSDSNNLDNNVSYDPSQIASLSYNTATRTLHVVFVDPISAGSTGQFQVKMNYINGITPNNYNPGIKTTIDASNNVNTPAQGGGTGPVTSNTTNVISLASNTPAIDKSLKAGGAINNVSIFKFDISNGGSNGSLILNSPVVKDTLPAGASFNSATKFPGSNAPTTSSISGGRTVVTWTWPSGYSLPVGYSGTAYLNATFSSPTFSVGSTINNRGTISGTVNGLPIGTQTPQSATDVVTYNIAAPTPGAACYGGGISAATAWWLDHHILAGTNCNWFRNGWYNSGNTELDSVQLHYSVDLAVDMNTIRVEAMYNAIDSPAQAQILVYYKTNTSGGYIALGTYYSLDIYNGTTPVDHTVSLPAGQYITDVKFSIKSYGGSRLPIGAYQDMSYCGNARTAAQGKKDGTPIVEGTTYNPGNIGDDGTTVFNNSDGSYFYNGASTAYAGCSDKVEILSPRPVFYPPSKWIDNGNSFKASDIVNYQGRFYLGGNQTANGIVIRDTLDAKLIYQVGTSQYYNGTSWASITPVVTTFGAQTILTYNIGTATPEVDLFIKFDAQIKPGTAPTTISNRFGLTATTPNTLFTGLTDYVDLSVISAVALKVKKGQSGSCGTTGYVYYPEVAHTLAGGNVNYKITVINQGNVIAKDFVMIDAFPFIGDERGSNFFANMAAPATVSDPLSTVYYTTTTNPCSDDLNPAITPGGCNTPTWSTVPPTDLTTITGLKLTRSADLPVLDSIEITWAMKAPVGVPMGNIMNNSVNYQVSRADNGNQLLPATPNQVGMVADCVNPIGSLGNYVWIDRNKNGLQDEAASDGLNGVKVYLYKDNGSGTYVKVDSTITANDFSGNPGYYLFPYLHTGDYKVQFQTSPLDGYVLTTPVNQAPQVDGNSDANTTTGYSGVVHIDETGTGVNKDNMTIDAGYYPIGSLGNYVWYDDNRNGLQDEAANRGINGVKVYLLNNVGVRIDSTTTANDATGKPGYYNFIITSSGTYQVEFPTYIGNNGLTTQDATAGSDGNSDAAVATGKSAPIVMDIFSHGIPKNNPTIDAGYNPLGSLGNYVWLDNNNNGIQDEPAANGVNGVKVYLYKDNGSGTYVKVDSTITANDSTGKSGWYTFYHLTNGNYKVLFPTMIGNYPISDVTNQAMQTDLNNDANKATGFSGVVTINIVAGGLNKDNPTIDAGYRTNIGSLGNYVWYDQNGNGQQDEPASNGLNGVKVYLLDGAGNKIDSTITANNPSNGNPGYYNFPNLNSGNYQVQFPTSNAGFPLTSVVNQATQVDGNSDANTTTGKSGVVTINTNSNNPLDVNNPTIDGGYGALGTLGNYVWYDDNNNGIQDEPAANGVNGVKVYLYKETAPGVYTKVDSTITTTDSTGKTGWYTFYNLYTANYKVQFPTMIGNYPISDVTNQASTTDFNNDANKATGFSGIVNINVGTQGVTKDNPTIDAGYRRNIGSLGNYVWLDYNNDGINNEPAANGVNGVKVYLLNAAGNKIDSTVTANDGSGNPGYYNFPNLLSGTYSVQFPTNVGNYPISDVTNQAMQIDNNNDANKATGKSGSVVINTASNNPLDVNNPTIDAGYRTNIGSLGNYVWYDVNGNGLQDEPASNGINGIKVYLLDGSGNKIDSTVTANNPTNGNSGYYNFPNLNSGNYQVQFPTTSGGFPITTQTTTAQTDGNSDANVTTGKSPVTTIITNSNNPLDVNNPTIDAGYVPIGTLGNYVWYDQNKNGLQDEPIANGLNDIKVILYKETTPGVYVKVDSMLTRNDSLGKSGWYTFYNLVAGNYKVQFPTSEGSYYLTPTNNQASNVDGNNDAGSNGFSGIVPLAPLSGGILKDNPTIDAGYYCDCNGFEVKIVKNKSFDCIQGNSFTFSANINRTGGKYFYSWDFGDGTTSTQANPTHAYATAGEYDVKLTVVENSFCGCRYEASVNQVYVGPKPQVAWDFQYNGNCLTYDFNSNSIVTMGWIAGFKWDFGNGQTSTQSNPLATFAAAGTYPVKLVVTTNYGCKDSLTINVDIINKCNTPVTCTPVPTITTTGYNVCNGDSVKLVAQRAAPGNSTYTYWYKDGVEIANHVDSIYVKTAGNYTSKTQLYQGNGSACYSAASSSIYIGTNCNVTSGGGGGVESKTLGDVIAVRLYGNAVNSTTQVDGVTGGVKFTNSGVVVNGANNLSLQALIPATVANTDAAFVSTPTDLVNFTNAVEVLAIDYAKAGSTKAVAFGTKTLGDVYTHTKPICDRLKGAELLEVKNVTVNGFNLMAYKVRQRTGEVEYAVNLSAGTAANRSSISLQSNWFTDSYQQDEKLYNFQLWAVSYDMVTSMATDIVTKLQANGTVNNVTNADLPKAYISKGSRKGTDLTVTVNNNTAATSGYFELHEKANENATTTTRQVAFTIAANTATNVTIPVRDNYEGDIYVYLNNKLTDLVYLADGTWALDYNKATTTISKFDVTNEATITNNSNEARLFRNVAVTGVSKDYITVYKTMMGGGLEQNVSSYKSLMFTANATGAASVTVTLVKKSITDWKNQYTYTIALDGNKEYGINLNQFKSNKYSNAIDANDITAVNFSFNSSRGVPTNMSINLSKARFAATSIATEVTANAVSIYPNPAIGGKFTTQFNSELAQPMVLKVIETSTGKIVKTQFINATKGNNAVAVTLGNEQANGLYIVTLETDGVKYNAAKLMVNKK